MKKSALAELFYDQCAGVYSGHMANIPNNPVLFSIVAASVENPGNTYAASKKDFAVFLREIADQLESED